MIPLLAFATFQLTTIKTLIENYVDLRLQSIQTAEMLLENTPYNLPIPLIKSGGNNETSFKKIPIMSAITNEYLYAKVSKDDYDRVMKESIDMDATKRGMKWRLDSKGHVCCEKRYKIKNQLRCTKVYLRKLILGKEVAHINGNKLDNRRENLVIFDVKNTKRIKRQMDIPRQDNDVDEDDFILFTPRVICTDLHQYDEKDAELKTYNGYAEITYSKDKLYSGEVKKGKPHGYGHLYEGDKNTQSCGYWSNGRMKTGMVLTFKAYPSCLCEFLQHCPVREISKLDVVKDGYRW